MLLFNAVTQKEEEAEMSVDQNNEIVARFEDGNILKFPAGLTKTEFKALVKKNREHNEGQEIIAPEMEAEAAKQRAASMALIEEDKTDVPEDSDNPE